MAPLEDGQAAHAVRLTVAPEPRLLGTVRLVVATAARRAGLDDEQVEDLKVAVSELCSAAVGDRRGPVEVHLAEQADRLVVEVVDAGGADAAADDDRAFGLALVGSLVDGLEWGAGTGGGRSTRFWLRVAGRRPSPA
jgi:anti-sigma regulatory factor (Ser/Thr protein kinase)